MSIRFNPVKVKRLQKFFPQVEGKLKGQLTPLCDFDFHHCLTQMSKDRPAKKAPTQKTQLITRFSDSQRRLFAENFLMKLYFFKYNLARSNVIAL